MVTQEVFEHVHHLRVRSWALLHEASGFVMSERLRRLNDRLMKYSPDQPRVPAGQRDGGQWTSGGGGGATSELPRSEGIVRNTSPRNEVSNRAKYPMGGEVINPNTQQPYVWPDNLDVEKNTRFGREFSRVGGTQIEKGLVMGYLFRAGGPEDYQRPNGLLAALGGDREMQYRDATNYNYGAVSASMGYTREEALSAAGTYNRYFGNMNHPNMTRFGIPSDAVNNISHVYDDYMSGYWPHPL